MVRWALLTTSALAGCFSEVGTDEQPLNDLTLEAHTAALTANSCTPESGKELRVDVANPARSDYPTALANSFSASPIEGAINDNGQVVARLSVRVPDVNGEPLPFVGSSDRGLRWNADTGEVLHIGVPANRNQGRVHSGNPHAMNGLGQIVGEGISCKDFVTGTVWRGNNPATTSANDEFTLAYASNSGADLLKKFCDRSATASDTDVTPEMPNWTTTQTVMNSDINANEIAVGSWNGEFGGLFDEEENATGKLGRFVIPALMHLRNVPGSAAQGAQAWFPDDTNFAGAMQAVPNSGIRNHLRADFEAKSPRLDFEVNVTTPGTYTVWVKGSGPNEDSDSVHVGLRPKGASSVASFVTLSTVAGWTKATSSLSMNTTGVYTVHVWMREDGVRFEKLVLTRNPGFVPTDENTSTNSFTADPKTLGFKWHRDNRLEFLSCTFGSSAAPVPGLCDPHFEFSGGLKINNRNEVISGAGPYFWDENNVLTNMGSGFKATALNNHGLVVGSSGTRAMVWSKTAGLIDVNRHATCGEFCNAAQNSATAVNDNGQVAGITVGLADGRYHAYSWTAAGGMVDRGTLGFVDTSEFPLQPTVVGINDAGWLIVNGPAGSNVAYYSAPGSGSDVLTPIPNMQVALGINNRSQIVGVGDHGPILVNQQQVGLGYRALRVWQPASCASTNLTDANVGTTGGTASTSAGGTVYTIRAGGADIFGTSDQFFYSYKQLSGNGTIIARVTGLTATHAYAKAGLMFRDNIGAGAANAMMEITPSSGAIFQRRLASGASTSTTALTGRQPPSWLRLTRSGNTFTGSVSNDGVGWTQVGTATFSAFSANALVGLAVTSHNVGQQTTATFDNLRLP